VLVKSRLVHGVRRSRGGSSPTRSRRRAPARPRRPTPRAHHLRARRDAARGRAGAERAPPRSVVHLAGADDLRRGGRNPFAAFEVTCEHLRVLEAVAGARQNGSTCGRRRRRPTTCNGELSRAARCPRSAGAAGEAVRHGQRRARPSGAAYRRRTYIPWPHPLGERLRRRRPEASRLVAAAARALPAGSRPGDPGTSVRPSALLLSTTPGDVYLAGGSLGRSALGPRWNRAAGRADLRSPRSFTALAPRRSTSSGIQGAPTESPTCSPGRVRIRA